MSGLLSLEDFKGNPMIKDPNLSYFDALLEVARIASIKEQEATIISKKRKRQEETKIVKLPNELWRLIRKMGGSEVSLLIEKKVYSTDVSPQHNRLSLPLNQMKNMDFLREEEENILLGNKKKKSQGLEIVLVEPSMEKTKIVLAKWDIGKTSSYVLRSSWMKVVAANGIEKDDILQLWSFRDIHQQLCIILLKLT